MLGHYLDMIHRHLVSPYQPAVQYHRRRYRERPQAVQENCPKRYAERRGHACNYQQQEYCRQACKAKHRQHENEFHG